MRSEPGLSPVAKKNIEAIVLIEQALLRRRSHVERFGAGIARFFGSLQFIVAHLCFIACWIILNLNLIAGARPFDPYPFAFLSFIIGVEFIFLTTFVLMNQNYQARHSRQWEHLHLQLSMLAEQEGTKNMEMLQQICKYLGIGNASQDQEVKELVQATQVASLVEEIGKARDESEAQANEPQAAKEADGELVQKLPVDKQAAQDAQELLKIGERSHSAQ